MDRYHDDENRARHLARAWCASVVALKALTLCRTGRNGRGREAPYALGMPIAKASSELAKTGSITPPLAPLRVKATVSARMKKPRAKVAGAKSGFQLYRIGGKSGATPKLKACQVVNQLVARWWVGNS